jgi:hypothetical protein
MGYLRVDYLKLVFIKSCHGSARNVATELSRSQKWPNMDIFSIFGTLILRRDRSQKDTSNEAPDT